MSLTIKKLVGKGYFPKELPPPFRTSSFAKFAAAAIPGPGAFAQTAGEASYAESFNLARAGTLRRPLSILNPIHFFRLARHMVQHWTDIRNATAGSRFSLTTPTPGKERRAIGRKLPFDVQPERRAALRKRGRFVLRADISRFYHSIYTHSIPWALHTKAWSKVRANRHVDCLGNQLDWLTQAGQGGQTNGIPVGPDTSLVIAEILLSYVDSKLSCGALGGMRYIDDYELVFDNEAQALEGLNELQQVLLELELNLNPAKTGVFPLPQRLENPWVTELKHAALDPFGKQFKTQLIRFFDRAREFAIEYPSQGVLKYAAGRLANVPLVAFADLIEDLMIQIARVEPGALPIVLEAVLVGPLNPLSRRRHRADLLLKSILHHSPQGHSSEVAWSLWGCIALGIPISKDVATAVLKLEDSVCALLLLHASSKGLVAAPGELNALQAAMTGPELNDTRWMLAYEANVKGWLPTPVDHVAANPNFAAMKAAGVSFYDVSRTNFPPGRRAKIGLIAKAHLAGYGAAPPLAPEEPADTDETASLF